MDSLPVGRATAPRTEVYIVLKMGRSCFYWFLFCNTVVSFYITISGGGVTFFSERAFLLRVPICFYFFFRGEVVKLQRAGILFFCFPRPFL